MRNTLGGIMLQPLATKKIVQRKKDGVKIDAQM
jgi:hypothetical protein